MGKGMIRLLVLTGLIAATAVPAGAMEIFVETSGAGKARFKHGILDGFADGELAFRLIDGGKLTLRRENIERVAFGKKPAWWTKGKKKVANKKDGPAKAKTPEKPKGKTTPKKSTLRDDASAKRRSDLAARIKKALADKPEKKARLEKIRGDLLKQTDPRQAESLAKRLVLEIQTLFADPVPPKELQWWMRENVTRNMQGIRARAAVFKALGIRRGPGVRPGAGRPRDSMRERRERMRDRPGNE